MNVKLASEYSGKSPFGNLASGDAFMIESRICMKVMFPPEAKTEFNAVDLTTGQAFALNTNMAVDILMPVNEEGVVTKIEFSKFNTFQYRGQLTHEN